MTESCAEDSECSNGDASDGEEICKKGECLPGNAPPTVVSITPEDGTEDVEPDAPITVVFSEPLDPETVTDALKLFDGDTEVPGTVELGDGDAEISFTPDAPLDLWTEYRLEISADVADAEGATLLDSASAKFQVRDGVWSLKVLDEAGRVAFPRTLPIASSGAILAGWNAQQEDKCSARARWLLRGQTSVSESFSSPRTVAACYDVAASVAPNGDAGLVWGQGSEVLSETFVKGAWQSKARAVGVSYGANFSFVAHDDERMTVFSWQSTRGGEHSTVDTGASTGTWNPVRQEFYDGGPLRTAFDAEGNGFATWSVHGYNADLPLKVMSFAAGTGVWSAPAVLVGTESPDPTINDERGDPGIAMGPRGEAMVLWVKRALPKQELMASRFIPNSGWQTPVVVSGKLLVDPIANSDDGPAVVFDGETYVGAWTAKSGDSYLTYTARYDMNAKRWMAYESHISKLGDSLGFMPRLGADSHGNLLLVWALATDPITLVYQRYRAATESWGEPSLIAGATFSDPNFESSGRLPFAVAPNGLGGLLIRNVSSDANKLTLAQFF